MLDTPVTLPPIPDSVLAARYSLQRALIERTSQFQWLRDTHVPPSDVPTLLDQSRMVYFSESNSEFKLTICVNSLSRELLYDSTIYRNTHKSWLASIIDYPAINPTRLRRFVS